MRAKVFRSIVCGLLAIFFAAGVEHVSTTSIHTADGGTVSTADDGFDWH